MTGFNLGFVAATLWLALGFFARLLSFAPFPAERFYAWLTYQLGIPEVFQVLHRVFGFGQAGKIFALVSSLLLWLGGLTLLGFLAILPASLAVALISVLFVGPFWGLVYGLLYALVRYALAPIAANPERRGAMRFLGWGAGVVAGGGVFALLQPLFGRGAATPEVVPGVAASTGVKLPVGVTSTKDFYYVSISNEALDPKIKEKDWTLEFAGLVKTPQTFSLQDLKTKFPATDLEYTFSCISNPVGGDLIGNALWRGVRLRDVLAKVGIASGAKWIYWEAADGFFESLPLAEALADDVLLAYEMNLEPLSQKHGFPLRVLLPNHYGMKQPRWLQKITLTSEERPGYWAQRGWSRTAFVQAMSRIDAPTGKDRIKAGVAQTVRGVGYAGTSNLDRVEVSFDAGNTWRQAMLEPRRSKHAWTRWYAQWTPSVGEHELLVRCVANGKTQSGEERDSLPEAASGYHRVIVEAKT